MDNFIISFVWGILLGLLIISSNGRRIHPFTVLVGFVPMTILFSKVLIGS